MAFLQKRSDVYYIYWQQNGKKHGKSLGTKRKMIAEQYLNEFEFKLSKRQLGQQTDITLDRLRDEYLTDSRSTKTTSAYERHDLPRLNRFVDYLKGIGLERASQITRAHLESYQRVLLEELAPVSVRHTMYAASGLLTFAVRRGYLSENVVKSVAKVKVQKNPPRFLSREECERRL